MTKSKLEKVLEYLINQEEEKARDLLHQVFVEKAREIHESLMQDEDSLDLDENELSDDEVPADEEYFGEEDFDDEGEGEADDDETADLAADMLATDDEGGGEEGGEEEAPADDFEGGDEMGGDEGEVDLEDAIAELQAEFERLQQEVEDLKGGEEGGEAEEFGGEEEGEIEAGALEPVEDEDEVQEGEAGIYGSAGDDVNEDEDFLDELDALLSEDWDDLNEAAVDDLQTVQTGNTHAEVGAGTGDKAKFSSNDTSPIPQKSRTARQGGKPHKIGDGPVHKGYDRESAPSSGSGTGAKSPKNIRGKHTSGNSRVDKSGDSGALLNKGQSDGYGEEGKTSPIGSKGGLQGAKGVQK